MRNGGVGIINLIQLSFIIQKIILHLLCGLRHNVQVVLRILDLLLFYTLDPDLGQVFPDLGFLTHISESFVNFWDKIIFFNWFKTMAVQLFFNFGKAF